MRFRVNLLVVGKNEWTGSRLASPWLAVKPSPNLHAHCRWQQRSGLPTRAGDHWWHLAGDGSNADEVGGEVRRALEEVLVPAPRRHLRVPT